MIVKKYLCQRHGSPPYLLRVKSRLWPGWVKVHPTPLTLPQQSSALHTNTCLNSLLPSISLVLILTCILLTSSNPHDHYAYNTSILACTPLNFWPTLCSAHFQPCLYTFALPKLKELLYTPLSSKTTHTSHVIHAPL